MNKLFRIFLIGTVALFMSMTVQADSTGVDESAGTCELYKELTGIGDDELDCSPGPNYDACGSHVWEERVYKQGPDIDDSEVSQNEAHYFACASNDPNNEFGVPHQEGYCVLGNGTEGTSLVPEGYVANVAPYLNEYNVDQNYEGFDYPVTEEYQSGENAPDWSVCLDRGPSFEGEWYNLDEPEINEYLRDNEDELDLSVSQRSSDPHDIDYYYTENPNPYHATYNPQGEERGVALLADCGPLTDCGNEADSIRGGINTLGFFAFFEHEDKITEYHPQGEDEPASDTPVLFDAYVNEIHTYPDNNQLSPGHHDYDELDPEWYEDTQVGEDISVQYAYTRDLNWSVDTSGIPYPPYGATSTGYDEIDEARGSYYRIDYDVDEREDILDETVNKTSKAFGNSLAVTATDDIPGTDIDEGQGFWINPDNVEYHWEQGHIDGTGDTDGSDSEGWKDLITFDLDITGPDSGIGYDMHNSPDAEDGGEVYETRDTTGDGREDTIFADIVWEQENPIVEGLNPPVCGDDQNEYLVEEQGESTNPEEGSGRYACLSEEDQEDLDQCVSFEGDDGQSLYNIGEYHQTNERGEQFARPNHDLETCRNLPHDSQPTWYDQDYRQDFCRENTLYGSNAKRWMDIDYIENHPKAVTGGIDDSWNDYLAQIGHDSLDSEPDQDSWTADEVPVPTGNQFDVVADPVGDDYGFCAGDDEGENFITQECNSEMCETDRNIQGVARNDDYCVLERNPDDRSTPYEVADSDGYSDETNSRKIYQSGDEVTFDLADEEERTISCFGGTWQEDFPINIHRSEVQVPLGDTLTVPVDVINVREEPQTFEVELQDPIVDGSTAFQFSEFESTESDTVTVDLDAQDSERFYLRIRGGTLNLEEPDLTVTAQSDQEFGDDEVTVDVIDVEEPGTAQDTRNVPGIGTVQILALTIVSTLTFMLFS